jgi:hypothetical protein
MFSRGNSLEFWLCHEPLRQLGQVLVQRLHAHAVAGLDGRVHLRDFGFADQISDGAGA